MNKIEQGHVIFVINLTLEEGKKIYFMFRGLDLDLVLRGGITENKKLALG